MITPKLPHIDSFRDRHGRTRYYFRRKHGTRTPLPGEPFSEEFMAAYRRACDSELEITERIAQTSQIECSNKTIREIRKLKKGCVYFVQGQHTNRIKIGYSIDPLRRVKSFQAGCSETVRILGAIPGTEADERSLHRKFAEFREKGEWFRNDRRLVNYIEEVCKSANIIRNSWDDLYESPPSALHGS